MGEWFGDWFRTFDRDYRFEVTEARELAQGLIFLYATHGGSGRLSGVEVHDENAYLYRVRDGEDLSRGLLREPGRGTRCGLAAGVVAIPKPTRLPRP